MVVLLREKQLGRIDDEKKFFLISVKKMVMKIKNFKNHSPQIYSY